jgi:hypothetical protein
MTEVWRQQGTGVTVARRLAEADRPADALFLHVDLSHTGQFAPRPTT